MRLILEVPALQAHSTPRLAEWQCVVAEFAAERAGQAPDTLRPQAAAHACLGAAVAAYAPWLRQEDSGLSGFLDETLRALDGPAG